ncbi:Hypothetical protein R9X50_00628700 [Acrodontium crateriforme]|uniref:Uncharacterized protein n=1 Tax=Acrodontium crateriforme TaxID=150365 RepID=A0AAQ3MD54_9PEZI|nr:Hypothetical protein R9X50_00628700 [Acrodontium crateriforme]
MTAEPKEEPPANNQKQWPKASAEQQTLPAIKEPPRAAATVTTTSKPRLTGNEQLQFPGPIINSRPTTVRLFNYDQLINSAPLLALKPMINAAFRTSGLKKKILGSKDRLVEASDFYKQIGNGPETFTYIVSWADEPDSAIGTVCAKRYVVPEIPKMTGDEARDEYISRGLVFSRIRAPKRRVVAGDAELEMWELCMLTVDPTLQRQGLAGYLLRLVDDGVRMVSREVREQRCSSNHDKVELVMVMTCIRELNDGFYSRRGYELDYDKWHEIGTLESEAGFTIGHYSKLL